MEETREDEKVSEGIVSANNGAATIPSTDQPADVGSTSDSVPEGHAGNVAPVAPAVAPVAQEVAPVAPAVAPVAPAVAPVAPAVAAVAPEVADALSSEGNDRLIALNGTPEHGLCSSIMMPPQTNGAEPHPDPAIMSTEFLVGEDGRS
ncbi:hypothetical protein PCANC_02544 [Puccinia coronata f. sp. avenae]|uniref:Uncharacterized protein n=1 Tax=Puccinia coronata f. sp. avenae TaxID=200324 RepID=A0A2N5VKZ8_9BASI|nr:hypothetical protein PCANC_03842 [Puccinia coronata f. sp. avenae]PLW28241.1 hypothetical protein PCASD_17691 [Puccinia coronata f. sp. avenae]PLW50668.1 hypothetical protein PCASD_00694 [Puccinia coronata f. sp. avenae]PLW55032.1 hypothetical protein PCANC_02544 [Puccinia coronata f. sp. avenae]